MSKRGYKMNNTETCIQEIIRFQRRARDYAYDAQYYREHGITGAACRAQQKSEIYSKAALELLAGRE
jgi:hypothetical protein